MTAKYDVLSQTVEALLAQPSAQFKIPPFQRKYAWGAEEIGQLVDDLFGESTSSELPYFLGSIVLARQEGVDLAPELVLDGQQRLTTLSLLISVLIHKTRQEGKTDADWNKMYLFSRNQKGKKTPKVILQPDDAKVFELLINEPDRVIESALKATALGEAIAKIFTLLEDYAQSPQYKDAANPYEEMLSRLIYSVEFVKITAPSERDAFRLFETLNDRGLALSAADLIKNKLFSRCKEELDDAIESWSNLLLLTKDDDVVNFLRSYWIAFEGFARKRGLYDLYKNRIDQLGSTEATLFVLDLEEVAKSYEQIVTPNLTRPLWGPEVAAVLERLSNSYRARSCRPVLLAFAKSRPNDMERIAKLCEAITVRYSIVGEKNPNRLERTYAEMCNKIRQEKDPWIAFRESSIFDEVPDDEEFQARLAKVQIPNVTSAWREVLIQLNKALGGGEVRLDRPSRVHVEHILSQRPRATALTEAGLSQENAPALVHRLGNLTLLLGRRNQQLSNRPFSEKREIYAGSDVFLTRELSKLERWSSEDIEHRSYQLAEAAVALFPHPVHISSSGG